MIDEHKKPNLLFMMLDQLRFDAVGINGNEMIKTPNMDKLASTGLNFQSYYTNTPVCVPSRCSLFTGRYPHSHKVRENHTLLESGREIHLFRILKKEGYSLGYVGKNHLLQNEEFANFNYVDIEENHNQSNEELECYEFGRERLQVMEREGAWAGASFHPYKEEATAPYVYTSSAINFIENRKKDSPFCLCLSILEPHCPHIAPDDLEELYQDREIRIPVSAESELKEKARRYYIKYLAQHSEKATEEDKRKFISVYYSMVTLVDRQIGRIMDALHRNGLYQNTVVVLCSDHGDFLFDHGMCKKDLVLLDSLLHVPLFISYPARLQPRVIDETFMEEVDVLPTLLDMMGVESPFGIQGKSILPYIRGERDSHKTEVFAEICPPWLYNPFETYEEFANYWLDLGHSHVSLNVPGDYNKCIRTQKYKYIWYGTGEDELYDLENDAQESKNLAAVNEYQPIKKELKMRLLEWNALSEDPLDAKLIDILQLQYDHWIGGKKVVEKVTGPYWLEYRFHPEFRLKGR